MSEQYTYQPPVRTGDPTRNKFAITSFILSVVSLVLSPILIIQITGIVLAAKGMNSQQRGLSIAGLVINILTIVMGMGMIAAISITMFGGVVANAREKADVDAANQIQIAISTYIEESGDIELTMGTGSTVAVQELLSNLQKTTTIDGRQYGPYLTKYSGVKDFSKPQSTKKKGWNITIDKGNMELMVSPSETGDSINIQ